MKPNLTSVPTDLPTPPYPSTTRARGWRFDIDYERLLVSDTWALTSSQNKPWLLMIWLTSWHQNPAGTFTNCDETIAAKIGIEYKLFMMERDHLMRGWRLHSDGLLYHDTVTDHVIEMIAKREKETVRKAAYREAQKAKMEEEQRKRERGEMSHGTPAGLPPLSHPSPPPTPTPTPTPTERNKEKRGARFVKPTLAEVQAYVLEKRLANVDPEAFMDHFDSNGWKVSGKGPMKDWKASVRGWNRRDFNGNGKAKSYINGGI